MKIAIDLDNTALAFPKIFYKIFQAFQKNGDTVGVLTGNHEDHRDDYIKLLTEMDIKPDFFICKDNGTKDTPVGIFKGVICREGNIDILFDDFQNTDSKIVADFFSVNTHTVPFTTWGFHNVVDIKAKLDEHKL